MRRDSTTAVAPWARSSPASAGWVPGECLVPVSFQSHSRPPPGYSLKSFPAPIPSTSMRPQETARILGDLIPSLMTNSPD